MTATRNWGIKEEPEGFVITKDGEDFMGWYRTKEDAETGIQQLRDDQSLPVMLNWISASKRPRLG